jgi:hypothetical protein
MVTSNTSHSSTTYMGYGNVSSHSFAEVYVAFSLDQFASAHIQISTRHLLLYH